MVVYIEYAFLENALLDGTLLYVTHKCVRARIRVWRFLFAAALGGAEAVVFPLLPLPAAAAYAVKILGGMLLCAACVPLKKCLPACAAFFALTFLLGGLLTAAYSFFGIETADGTAFYVERAPVALILGGAAAFVCAALAAIGRGEREATLVTRVWRPAAARPSSPPIRTIW